jgi:lysophospholipase L1-like esterase
VAATPATLHGLRSLAVRLAVVVLGVSLVLPASARPLEKPRVTFIGDSVAASLLYVDDATRRLRKGFDLHLELKVCRRLVATSCTYQGETPATALQVIESSGSALGDAVVIMVGYNDSASTYRSGLDQVMRALVRAGVDGVVWVTLGESRDNYRLINGVIRKAASRYARLTVADWASLSNGKDWFGSDGLHLEPDGAVALARLIRSKLLAVT